MQRYSYQKGFTLVELAIVLVIIGLIIASVLGGKELIRAGEIRALVKQYNEFQTGVTTFAERYHGLPGDINGARFGLTGGCDNNNEGGNNNGLIESKGGGKATHDGEVACFWANLTTAGKELVTGSFDGVAGGIATDVVGQNMPKMKLGSLGWSVYSNGSKNYFITGVQGSQPGASYNTLGAFTAMDAYNLDYKIDDGVPTAGAIQTRGAGQQDPDTEASTDAGPNTGVCNNTQPNPIEYQFTAVGNVCALRFDMLSY
jgi:prepilin-type N-terminal cleavage/methylation domain-containing protein